MTCSRCGLRLPPGSAHLNPESCVEALKHALSEALSCKACAKVIPVPICPPCAVTSLGRGLLERGASNVVEGAKSGFLDWFMRQRGGEDSPPARDERGGKRFVP